MGKLFGLILMLAALYVGMTIYTEGLEQAFGGIFAPLESVNDSTAPMATQFTPAVAHTPSRIRCSLRPSSTDE